MNKLTSFLVLLLPSLVAAQQQAISAECRDFRLDVNGLEYQWQNWQNGNSITTDTSTGEIRWGVGPDNQPNSGMRATSAGVSFPMSLPINTQFALGQLTHLNFPIYVGGAVTSVELMITVHTSHGSFSFVYMLEVDETPNIRGECEHHSPLAPCADQILIINDPAPQTFATMDGKEFEIDLIGFRDSLVPSAATTTEFISQEGGESHAYLFGSLFLTDCPRDGGGMGDPHFQTWTGNWYDFHGACDLHLVNAPNFAEDTSLAIDVRTKTRDWYSFIERAAILIGDDILEVAGFADYYLNGVSGFGNDFVDQVKEFAGFPLSYSHPQDHVHVLEIAISNSESIVIRSFKDMIAVRIQGAHKDRFEGSIGMMGDFETGEVYARGGRRTILEDPTAIAREWQVRDDEPMLFQAVRAPQYPETCVMPKKQQATGRRLGRTVALEKAKEACAHWAADVRELCIQDVMKTGDLEMATADGM